MTDFQDYLDGALEKVSFTSGDDKTINSDYDVFGEISEQIIRAREEAQLTQKDLARLSGVTQSNISNIECGNNRPTISTLKKIADALGKRLVVDFKE